MQRNKNTSSNIYTIFTLLIAAILWYIMFVIKPMNFWIEMSLSISILVILGLLKKNDLFKFDKIQLRHIVVGVVSAIILYFVFYAGNIVSGWIFPFKDAQILSVYSNKTQSNPILIGMLLLFIIGPGEEIFWRGFIQNTLVAKLGENKGYIFAVLLYAGVHITTGNIMLVIAALVCGLFWGWLYKRERSLIPIIISHALWDIGIFLLFPLM